MKQVTLRGLLGYTAGIATSLGALRYAGRAGPDARNLPEVSALVFGAIVFCGTIGALVGRVVFGKSAAYGFGGGAILAVVFFCLLNLGPQIV